MRKFLITIGPPATENAGKEKRSTGRPARDLTGMQFKAWTAIRRSAQPHLPIRWLCRCICGAERWFIAGNLCVGRHRANCGCASPTPHYKHAEYRVWKSMKARCENPAEGSYRFYGAKGIRVCDRWRDSFDSFLADMGKRPTADHSIDRINALGDYEPGNCRWATSEQQARNRTNNRVLELDGVRKCAADWGREFGIRPSQITRRIDHHGWSVSAAITTPTSRRTA